MRTDKNILIIDDDALFNRNVASFFSQRGQSCEYIRDPRKILSVDLSKFSLILLDINMPGLHGLSLLPLLKANHDIPVIMVSGVSNGASKIAALKAGAEFYFTKPVALEELYFVCARRLSLVASEESAQVDRWTLDIRRHQLTSPEGRVIGLTQTETRLLAEILRNAPLETDRLSLLYIMTGQREDDPRAHRSLEVILSRLRTRFRHLGETLPIKASRNVGYTFLGAAKVLN
jgi:two-component system, OmpR family, response regulator